MAFVPFENICRLTAVFRLGGVLAINTHHYRIPAGNLNTTLWDIAQGYAVWWENEMAPLVHGSTILDHVECLDLTEDNGIGLVMSQGLPATGGIITGMLPNNVTMAVKWSTGRTGRSYRGRTYHIGLAEAQVSGNELEFAQLVLIKTAYSHIVQLPTASGAAQMVVASRVQNGVQLTEGIATNVIDVTIDGWLDSQRRRLPGRGQ